MAFDFPFDDELFRKKISSRHHYLPKFYLNGFTNSEGNLYVYDKLKDTIGIESKSPKSVFYEWDRNTINIQGDNNSSFIEDYLYSILDSQCSKVVNHFSESEFEDIKLDDENMSSFLFFIIVLFWRVPHTDFAVNDILDRAVINSIGIDPDILRNDETFRKIQRSFLINHTIDQIISSQRKLKSYSSIQQFTKDVFVIGDSPIVFRRLPNTHVNFVDSDYIIALSSRRLYSYTLEKPIKYEMNNVNQYNACVINQSNRYVASSNLQLLQNAVNHYNSIKQNLILYFNDAVFNKG